MQKLTAILFIFLLITGCKAAKSEQNEADGTDAATVRLEINADSAYEYVKRQVDFGPRVPNSAAHDATRQWLVDELTRRGARVTEQKADLKAFDGTTLRSTNIIGQFNPDADDRILLLAHYDCRPWADEDADPAKQELPVDGANDGASGVGVLLEIARQLSIHAPEKGVDILFVDAEDYGSHDDDESWALGTKYFARNPFTDGYAPSEAILLDMVGGRDAKFYQEYFSMQHAGSLAAKVWALADELGYSDRFINKLGGAVTDDHVPLNEIGIPTIDIIEYDPKGTGFNATWHTSNDNMDHIDRASLKAVGDVVLNYVMQR